MAKVSIRTRIIAGEIAVGQIYSVPSLADSLGVSVTPVREAMIDLVAEGLVEAVPNRGFRVIELSSHDLDEILELRLMLEVPATAELASGRRGDVDFDTLHELAEVIEAYAAVGDTDGFLEADRDFHLSLLSHLGNDRLIEMVSRLRDQTRLYGVASLAQEGQLAASACEHRQLLEAIGRGDAADVSHLVTRHLHHTRGIWAGCQRARPGMSAGPSFRGPSGFPNMIDGDLLRALVPMADAIEATARAFAAVGRGEVSSPLRSTLSRDRTLIMSAEHMSGSALVKVISSSADGWSARRPSIEGSVLWIDGQTGRVEAVLDAGALTALRTGAASGLVTSLLAPADATVLAMLGAGDQAADQIAGMRAVRPIQEVRVFSRRIARREELCRTLAASSPEVTFIPVESPRQAVRGADIVCAATRATSPLFEPADLVPTVHVNAVGAFRKEMCEVPAGAFGLAGLVVVDQVEAALTEAGDLIRALESAQLPADGLVTVAELLSTEIAPLAGRRWPGITIFKSVGIAAQDWAVAELVVSRAQDAR